MRLDDEIEHNHNSLEIHKKASENLSFALVLNLLFNIVVISGGILTNSVAIISDAMHDLSDTISIFIAWVLEKLSRKESTKNFTYGYQRFSIFGALFNSTLVIIASLTVVYEAVSRLFEVQSPDASGMVVIAVLGIIFKGFSLLKLHNGKTFNEKAISIHMFGDVFEWVALLIISLTIVFVDIPLLDPIASILVSLWVIYNLAKTFIASTKIILQAIPSDVDIDSLKEDFLSIEGIEEIEELHIWSLDGIDNILTSKFKISKDEDFSYEYAKKNLKKVTHNYNITQTTFEFN